MKTPRRFATAVIFSLAQFAWFGLLGLWIYWYVSNYLIFIEVGERISPQIVLNTQNVAALVGGIVLLVAVATGLLIIFTKLNEQIKVTRMYDGFIANVTHELKSPLASIRLYLETLESRNVPPEKQREFLAMMMKDSERLNDLINAILEITSLEEKKRLFDPTEHEAEPLVRSLVHEAAEQFKVPSESVHFIGEAPCRCRVDRRAMKVVLNNLVDNAVKYTVGPADITVSLSCTSNRLVIEVRDRGIGIPKQSQKEIFQKFRRLNSPESPSVKGVGLGLYWVREIVRQHRGNVTVASEGRNRGTTFRIELPAYASADGGGER